MQGIASEPAERKACFATTKLPSASAATDEPFDATVGQAAVGDSITPDS